MRETGVDSSSFFLDREGSVSVFFKFQFQLSDALLQRHLQGRERCSGEVGYC